MNRFPREQLAVAVAEECDALAEKYWWDREKKRYADEHDPLWSDPNYWLKQSRPPVRSCGAVLAHIMTEYEPGDRVELVDVLQWANDRYESDHDDGYRRLAHGFYRASSALRKKTGFGYPDPDPVLGGLCDV